MRSCPIRPATTTDFIRPSTSRRSFLQSAAVLALMGYVRSATSEAVPAVAFCSNGEGDARPLLIPRDRGSLGRLALGGKPLTLVAARAAGLPRGIGHGSLAYRAHHDGRDYLNP